MIRHRKQERRRRSNFNTSSWKTSKSIDEVYESLVNSDSTIDFTFPYNVEEYQEGREAIFRSESGNYQVCAHEYSKSWKDTEIDLIYFGNVDEEVNEIMDSYRTEI